MLEAKYPTHSIRKARFCVNEYLSNLYLPHYVKVFIKRNKKKTTYKANYDQ